MYIYKKKDDFLSFMNLSLYYLNGKKESQSNFQKVNVVYSV